MHCNSKYNKQYQLQNTQTKAIIMVRQQKSSILSSLVVFGACCCSLPTLTTSFTTSTSSSNPTSNNLHHIRLDLVDNLPTLVSSESPSLLLFPAVIDEDQDKQVSKKGEESSSTSSSKSDDSSSSSLSSSVRDLPPVLQQITDERRNFQMNLGKAMDTLRKDMPYILKKSPGM